MHINENTEKSTRRGLRSFWILVLMMLCGLAQATPTIYNLDMRSVWNLTQTTSYDQQHTAVCVQGLANREAPRVFLTMFDGDTKALDRLVEPGGLCEGWNVVTVNSVKQLVSLFRSEIKGLVLYDPSPTNGVISTSLAATTAAGIENAIAVRKDPTSGSMYDFLAHTLQIPVLIDLTGKFTGHGVIWDCGSTPSSGSAKCDAYIWAKRRYIDSGLCDPTVLSYTLDLWALKANAGNSPWSQISNLDYAISKKGFCFELSPWGDEAPNDDPTQPVGTDRATWISIMNACNQQTGKSEMIKFCGFTNWHMKYTSTSSSSVHGDVETEWETVKLTTAYNIYLEADAPGLNYISNSSFYSALLPAFLDRRHVQNPAPTYNDMVSEGLIGANGAVVPGNYVLMGMGDYDQATWTQYWLAGDRYDDPVRGTIPCTWGVDPNVIDRACAAIDYMYRNKSPKDYFMAWDSGAGYINPGQLYGSRSPSGYPSGVEIWQKHCKKYYRLLDYSISGWLLNGSTNMTQTDCQNYAPFSGDGIGLYHFTNIATPSLVGNIPIKELNDNMIDYSRNVHFAWYRTVIQYPRDIKAQMDAQANSGHNHRFLDAYRFYYLMRYHLGGNNNYRATWVSDTIPRIMASGKDYPVTITVRNDGWDTWSEADAYRLGFAMVPKGQTPVYADYDTNGRHELPAGASVAPGQSVTFSLTITAPANGTYDLHYDLVRDGFTWFREQNNIEWQQPLYVATDEMGIDTDGDGSPDVIEMAKGTLYWDPFDLPADTGVSGRNAEIYK